MTKGFESRPEIKGYFSRGRTVGYFGKSFIRLPLVIKCFIRRIVIKGKVDEPPTNPG
jgi:hypothetical protein